MNLISVLLILLLLGCAQTGLIKPETGIIDNERTATVDPQQAMLEQARAFRNVNPGLFGEAGGVLVIGLVPGGQGEKIGLKSGDMLLTYGGNPLQAVDQLIQLTNKKDAQASVTLTYLREGKQHDATLQGGRIGIQISSLVPNQSKEIDQIIGEGNQAYNQSRFQHALKLYRQALDLSHAISYRKGETASLGNLGNVYQALSQYPQAIEYHEASLAIEREIGNRKGEAQSLTSLSNVYKNLSQYPQALKNHEASLAIFREIGDHSGEAASLNNLGLVYENLNQYPKAIEHHEASLAIERKIGDRSGEAASLGNLGNVYYRLSQYPQAIEHHEASLAIDREIGNLQGEAASLDNLGNVYQALSQYPRALEHHEASLAIKREIGDRLGEATSLNNLGLVYYKLNQYLQSLQYTQQALAIQIVINESEGLWRSWDNLSDTLQKLNHTDAAIFMGKQAVNTLQGMRSSNFSLERNMQDSFLKNKTHVYHGLVALLIEQGRLVEAEQVMAMLKEEEYFDFIQRDGQDDMLTTQAGYTQVEKGITTQINQFSNQLVSLGKEYENLEKLSRIDEQAKVRLTKVEKELEQAQAGFLKLLSDLENYFKQASSDKALELGERQLERLESQQGLLGKHQAVIITTIVTKEKIHLLLTTPEVQLARESAIGEKTLNDLIKRFRNALKHPGSDPVPLAQELYTYLVKPLEKDLQQAQAKTLMWSLDGALRYVPLATLHDGQQFLIEKYGLSLYTAAAHNNLHENNVGSWRAAGLGVSQAHPGFEALPAVPNELRNIIRKNDDDQIGVLSGEIHLDRDFNRETFKSVVRAGYPVLHIASHFKLQPGDGSASKLLLGDGDTLSLDEFRRQAAFKLHGVDLLTLSACDTAVGDKGAGGEVESFAVMAQLRGANGVLASLWRVEDESTALLMQHLYRLLSGDGRLSKAEALRQAQIKLLRGEIRSNKNGEKFSHPYFWAPFVMMGNWL